MTEQEDKQRLERREAIRKALAPYFTAMDEEAGRTYTPAPLRLIQHGETGRTTGWPSDKPLPRGYYDTGRTYTPPPKPGGQSGVIKQGIVLN